MSQAHLLIRNTLAVYGRKALTVGLGLYGTRLLFQALGKIDVGIFNVVGASTALIAVLGQSFMISAVRHLSHALGREDREEFRILFNTTLVLFALIAVLVFIVGQLLAPCLPWLNIPEERLDTAFWVYQSTLAIVIVTLLAAPCSAVLTANQALVLESMLAIPGVVLTFLAVWLLFYVPGDRLLAFAWFLLAARTIHLALITTCCFVKFPDSRMSLSRFRKSRLPRIGSFAGWTALGGLTWSLRMKGSSILLNLFFGPALNASWDVSTRASNYHAGICHGIGSSVTPAIITAEGRGNRRQMISLMFAASKFSTLISLFLAVPIAMDAGNVLNLWIENPPAYAAAFVAYILIALTIDNLNYGNAAAMNATGEIGAYTRYMFRITLLPIPIACAGFYVGLSPMALPILILVFSIGSSVYKVSFVARRLGFTMKEWYSRLVLPVLMVATIGTIACLPVRFVLDAGWLRFLAISVSFAIAAMVAIWRCALSLDEKTRFVGYARHFWGRITLKERLT